jgi:hypothetical protein
LSRFDSEASKKDGAPIRPATDRAQGGDTSAFLTERALPRLAEGLRDQRDPRSKADGATELRRNNEGRRFSEADALLCALLLVVGAVALPDWQKARTAGPIDAALVNIEAGRAASVAPDNDQPPQPITNALKFSAAMPGLPPQSPPPPNEKPVEAQEPVTLGASETVGVAQTPVEAGKDARTKFRAQGVRKVEGRLPPIWRIPWVRPARLFAHRRVAETEELQQMDASIRRPIQYGRCWLNNHQTYYHWAECLR